MARGIVGTVQINKPQTLPVSADETPMPGSVAPGQAKPLTGRVEGGPVQEETLRGDTQANMEGGGKPTIVSAAAAQPPAGAAAVPPVAPAGGFTEDMLVSKQLTKLLGEGSPLIERARTKAMETAASRGLQNSSIAAGAGEAAAIDSMLPVAQGNAAALMQNRMATMDDARIRELAGSDDARIRELAQAELASREKLSAAELANRSEIADKQLSASLADAAARQATAQADISSRERIAALNLAAAREDRASNQAFTAQQSQLQRDWNSQENQQQRDFNAQQNANLLSRDVITQWTNAHSAIDSNPNLSTEDRITAHNNVDSLWRGSPYAGIVFGPRGG